MAEYYKVDSRKISLREYWNILPSWKILIPWLAARFNVPTKFGSGFRLPDTVRELEIPESEFPSEALAALRPLLEEALQLGFHSHRFFTFESIRRDTRTSFIALLHRSGEFTLRLMHTLACNVNPPRGHRVVALMSELNDGTLFFTSDQKAKFRNAPGKVDNRLVGASLAQLVESHQQKLASFQLRNPPRPVHSTAALDEAWDRSEKSALDFNLKRGLYVRMSAEEVQNEQMIRESAKTMAAAGVEHADVLVELNQLQNKKAGWGNTILLFLVSMLLFVGAGSRQWSWDYVVILVPILFVHELGHYVAMRAFHYRNLRMFFIPFFGAAVAGQHYNVPGWKKVIVSMMGPVPGIILGVMIGGAGLVLHQPLLLKVAIVALILNGINLLPILPLDGGWVFHTLLFSRHQLLDAAFRALAAVALLARGMSSNDKILMYIAIPMMLGIPAAYRMARITRTLRERGVPPGSPDNQTIPQETAIAIVGELKKNPSKGQTNKMLAQQALQIFETLNARPPGWAATVALLGAYVASVGMAAVFAGVFVVGQRGDFSELLTAAATQPKRSLVCGHSAWRGNQAGARSESFPITLIATFSKRDDAQKSFQLLTNQLPQTAGITTFGDSLLLALPEGESDVRKEWFGVLQRQTKEVFVDSTNFPATMSVSCQMANDNLAKQLAEELNEYFSAYPMRSLIPPWLPDDHRTREERAAHELARKSYSKARTGKWGSFKDPRMHALQKRLAGAQRQGDEAEVTDLTRQMTELRKDLENQRLARLKAGEEGPIDVALIDLYKMLPAIPAKTNRDVSASTLEEIARRMGQLPLVDGRVTPIEDRFSTHSGSASSKARSLRLNWMSFKCISDGSPALLDWLCAKGCTDFKYELRSGLGFDPDEKE